MVVFGGVGRKVSCLAQYWVPYDISSSSPARMWRVGLRSIRVAILGCWVSVQFAVIVLLV